MFHGDTIDVDLIKHMAIEYKKKLAEYCESKGWNVESDITQILMPTILHVKSIITSEPLETELNAAGSIIITDSTVVQITKNRVLISNNHSAYVSLEVYNPSFDPQKYINKVADVVISPILGY